MRVAQALCKFMLLHYATYIATAAATFSDGVSTKPSKWWLFKLLMTISQQQSPRYWWRNKSVWKQRHSTLIHRHLSERQSNCWMTIIAKKLAGWRRRKKLLNWMNVLAWGAQRNQDTSWNLKRLLKWNEFVTIMELINCFLALAALGTDRMI